ncbi:precorrin-2 C(20)-methyltransferase [Burkholderia plantarii]|uniref:Precorrin-2 C(20)-methyltransferase n=1 Tax=Burkholderia plantarii TaxID=41899 RepID=A0A0B6RM53_BURPL|nr:precorrin-2 C(20)-methyltransferase [Burkholderia plantarii]AJK46362.1 precorrin-2 C(20)-methyltransferase CobI [Burkholderia plantarii]
MSLPFDSLLPPVPADLLADIPAARPADVPQGAPRGRLFGIGVGPGDPELLTLKAVRLLRAAPVVAYFVAKGKKGNAYGIVEAHLAESQCQLPLVYPVTTEALAPPLSYEHVIADFYDTAAEVVAAHLDAGRDVAVICEGDPFFYGSYMYLHDRLAQRYDTEVVPGVCSMLGGAAVLGVPLVYRNQTLSVLSGVLPADQLRARLEKADAAVVMKLGRNFDKVRRVLEELGLAGRALYVERATMANQRIVPLAEVDPMASPYFSLLVVPGEKWQG